MKKIITAVVGYIWRHWSAIILTVIVYDLALVNPFVVDRYQSIYKYPVTSKMAIMWDIIFVLAAVMVIIVDRIAKKWGLYDY